jgi:hypothetical protein
MRLTSASIMSAAMWVNGTARRCQKRPVVFISHSSAEKPSAEALARELARNGVKPWYAGWEIGPETQYVLSKND